MFHYAEQGMFIAPAVLGGSVSHAICNLLAQNSLSAHDSTRCADPRAKKVLLTR